MNILTVVRGIWTHLRQRLRLRKTLRQLGQYQNPELNCIGMALRKEVERAYSPEEEKLFERLEAYRSELLRDTQNISSAVFGAPVNRQVSEICRKAASGPKWCRFHYCLADALRSRSYLEMGTNLGISGSYLLAALQRHHGRLITMEGQPDLCAIAGAQFERIVGPGGFEIMEGLYEKTFPVLLNNPVTFDTVFIDANHTKDPTLYYFHSLKEKMTNPGVIIFDDISWSDEMREAWSEIQRDPDVNYAITFRKLGIVVMDKNDMHRNMVIDASLTL